MSTNLEQFIKDTNVSDELIAAVSGWTVEEVRDFRFDAIIYGRDEKDTNVSLVRHRRAPWYTIVYKKFLLRGHK